MISAWCLARSVGTDFQSVLGAGELDDTAYLVGQRQRASQLPTVLAGFLRCRENCVQTGAVDEGELREIEHHLVPRQNLGLEPVFQLRRASKVKLPLDPDSDHAVAEHYHVYLDERPHAKPSAITAKAV